MNGNQTKKNIGRATALALTAAILLTGSGVGLATAAKGKAKPPALKNGRIAFASDRVTAGNPDGDTEIFTMNADGSGVKQLTKNAAADFGPVWSPNGKKIAFTTNRDGNFEVYVMNA
ncbi:MAG TPA: hypothetical protein VFU81_00770, partial [Thermomicrobiales bacterium]|nr:hypothetical protein [Thermomicrobiales bacterium]